MNWEVQLRTNYTVTKATEEQLQNIADELGCPLDVVPSLLRNYSWKYAGSLKVWKGHNIVPLVLRSFFASLIAGNDPITTFKANYCALWSGSIPPSNSDTTLQTETIRGIFSNRYSADNIAYLDKFRNSSEVGGQTFNEVGVFVDWTVTTDSWYLLSRILMNETMTSTETLTINVSITIW